MTWYRQAWVLSVSATGEWLYLAAVMDVHTCQIIAWVLDQRMTTASSNGPLHNLKAVIPDCILWYVLPQLMPACYGSE